MDPKIPTPEKAQEEFLGNIEALIPEIKSKLVEAHIKRDIFKLRNVTEIRLNRFFEDVADFIEDNIESFEQYQGLSYEQIIDRLKDINRDDVIKMHAEATAKKYLFREVAFLKLFKEKFTTNIKNVYFDIDETLGVNVFDSEGGG